ncbi:MAG: dihydrolipoamide acetyltransferase family protein [Desulfobacterales bacterium]|jgi:pyruvate dehydrogenase E2 component (dihydrolipoamide acetyltransferase)|nr:dihydrolipoamide acetyltransferase family protein [Desulfobacterales bacterium]
MAEFRMPSLGSDMMAGTLIEWRVKPGDRVRRRDVVAVVETDKAAIEIEVYEDGIIETLLIQPGQKVPVGAVMAIIRTETALQAPSPDQASVADMPRLSAGKENPPLPRKATTPPSITAAGTGRIKASPYARKLAAAGAVDLAALAGTGPDGAIRAADIQKALSQTAGKAPQPRIAEQPVNKDYTAAMRRAIAAAMTRSKREIPHYYLKTRIDMSRVLRWLESENIKRPIKDRMLPIVPLIRAVALALGDVPELNGFWIDDHHRISEAIHIGFVISLRQGGLIAPALLNADQKCPDELMASLRDLIIRARSGGLRSSEMTDATVTITSLGDLGVEAVYGIIYPPQVALVGFGKTMEQPWAENGMLGVRPGLTATLSADHRATDGHRGAQFLDALNRYLQEPSKL